MNTEIDNAVDKLFGPYIAKRGEEGIEAKSNTLITPNAHSSLHSNSNDVDQIKQLTTIMLKYLNQASKARNWWHKLFYSNQFIQTALDISKLVTKNKSHS